MLALLLTAPFARLPVPSSEPFMAAYASAVFVTEIATAALLLGLFSVQRSLALLALASAYLFSGLLVVPWALTFPGVFAPDGLLGAGLQSTATIAALRRIGFPLGVLAYTLLPPGPCRQLRQDSIARTPLALVLGVSAIALGLVIAILQFDSSLPDFMVSRTETATIWIIVPVLAASLCVLASVRLWRHGRSVLDLWLMVVLFASIIEILLLSFISAGRLSLGWWAGRLYGLAAASVVLVVLLSETTTLYARLTRSILAERREREVRLAAVEAMAGSIAHEVNQPLASMVTNADAGLRWLNRREPDMEEARAAFRRIVEDGHRGGAVIHSLRSVFRKNVQDRTTLDINRLIARALEQTRREARGSDVSIEAEMGADLPEVSANAVQLFQVLTNLIANAVEAMAENRREAKIVRVISGRSGNDGIRVTVQDTGPGIPHDLRERIFEPFMTTKARGMGLGLMICRSIVEAHGGRLWVEHPRGRGARFSFTIPDARDVASTAAVIPLEKQA
ncbi:ATP-binding protein [Marinivivus vitaminiproducens]|nr:ATP-binding protein [Geminicoccaceae bacterium SCSIO 64248]